MSLKQRISPRLGSRKEPSGRRRDFKDFSELHKQSAENKGEETSDNIYAASLRHRKSYDETIATVTRKECQTLCESCLQGTLEGDGRKWTAFSRTMCPPSHSLVRNAPAKTWPVPL